MKPKIVQFVESKFRISTACQVSTVHKIDLKHKLININKTVNF